jgi:transcriptional regulator with XRE-family HTH domain
MQDEPAPSPATGHDAPMTCVTTHQRRPAQRTPRSPNTPWGRLRGERGWSLRDLAARSGVNIADLSRIERGLQGATPDQARAILEAYGPTDTAVDRLADHLTLDCDQSHAGDLHRDQARHYLELAAGWHRDGR